MPQSLSSSPVVAMFSTALPIVPIIACGVAAAINASGFEAIGGEAASSAPMPAPLPNTNRPPLPIVTNPLPDNALGLAMSSVPPLTFVPPRVGVRAAEDQLPAAADVQRRSCRRSG